MNGATMNGSSSRGKALPPRPSQDMGYGGLGMQNGYGVQSGSYESRSPPRSYGANRMNSPKQQEPPPRAILDGYSADIMNGFQGQSPRYNPMNAARPQSSTLLNLNDSIQVHLLVETALGDSKEYELLSQEEVDDLKKQVYQLTQRIEQTRTNLALQSKYRDAAISMGKLYLPSDKKKSIDGGKIRGLLGHNRNSSSEHAQEANQERMASEKKCEDLATELWFLEKRLMEPQMRLLKHTAGILQMTHKGPKILSKGDSGAPPVGGIPGSPESMYTYSNARNSIDPFSDDDLFDARSLYRSFERLDGFGDLDGGNTPKGVSKEQMQMITKTEQKLEDLNSRLREVIIRANPQQDSRMAMPPFSRTSPDGKPTEPGESLQDSLQYLEQGIATISKEQSDLLRNQDQLLRTQDELRNNQGISEGAMEETVEELNRQIHDILRPYDEIRPPPPQPTGNGLNNQLAYFQDIIEAVESELTRSTSLSSKSSGNQEQMETVMMGLWEIIRSGEEEAKQKKMERRKTRTMNGLPKDEDDMSSDDDSDPNEGFSLQGFSNKVQMLYSQATKLKDQKKVLQRQIKQQRELNSMSDSKKDAELASKMEELQRTQGLLTRTEADADNVRGQLSLMMEKLDEARQQQSLQDQARSNNESSAIREAQQELDRASQKIANLEEELQEMKDDESIARAEAQGRINDYEARISGLAQQLAATTAAQATFEASIKEKDQELQGKEAEMEELNIRLAELQTEVTIAKAELDGAYGSRAQRAAEVASNPAIQKEIDTLTKKNASLTDEIAVLKSKGTANPETEEKMRTLKKELEETIEEYEQMTKASIEWEKEREQLETTIDKLRDEREQLEAELSDEKVRWLGMKSPGMDGAMPGPGNTSTTVLKNEFKKMMRDTRAESAKALRAEQAERRRLEDELRALKRAQGPGKSSLSQSMGSS